MGQYVLSEEVFLTMLLHATKYPSCTVCGVLLGEPAKGNSNKTCTIIQAAPLFHLSMLLAPCVETALLQVEAYAQQQGLKLLGYYHSEGRFNATDVHPVAKRIADRLADRQADAFMAVLDNQKFAQFSRQGSNESPFELMLREGTGPKGSWKKVANASSGGGLELPASSSWEQLRTRFLNAHAAGLHGQLSDFDEHLDDISKDYLNVGLLGPETAVLTR